MERPLPASSAPVPAGPPGSQERAEVREVAAELTALGVRLDPATEEALALYLRRIRQWSERINLVSAQDVLRLGRRHLLESFNVLSCPFPLAGARLADAGSGAGFPGIPLALVEPTLEVLLIESVRKKAAFLARVAGDLGLDVTTVRGTSGAAGSGEARASSPLPARVLVAAERAEVLAASPEHRFRYGLLTVRGFGPLDRAVRECAALLTPGGFMVAFKGTSPEREVRDALAAMKRYGLVLADIAPMRWGEGRLVLLRRKEIGDCRS